MYCPQCGSDLETSTLFCPKCGSKLRAPSENHVIQKDGSQTLGIIAIAAELFGLFLAVFYSSSVLAELLMFSSLILGIVSLNSAYTQSGLTGFKPYFSFVYDGINNKNNAYQVCSVAVFLGLLIIALYLATWFIIGFIEA
ncbi:MAG: zinc ribbon domain-containing protein [Firmicutes bacterium]|uniref:Zinc-ribbon domain-containing protein n=1 Tax=Acetobacterium malicum TaxID=52692 RepID=A0ABR6Z1Z9_9FIRM|nr:zinc ribbon domain-containing protein [Acetobacterium malicum]MBC3901429.1 zinc-ribbon domain-containing protein [Acetobacterium malicum]MBU4439688.1 zinc ribbon domain-containing protein [Bacillota bacterium]